MDQTTVNLGKRLAHRPGWVMLRHAGGNRLSGVFINYRGEDTDTAASLIDRELSARFGSRQVFLDCRSVLAGTPFAEELLKRLRTCGVLLVVIGPRWLTLTDQTN